MKCPKCRTENAPGSKFCRECATPVPSAEKTPGHDDAQRHGLKDRPIFTETLADPPRELASGSTFAGRYQIIEELGGGGMGRVYRAFDRNVNEEVALKLIRPEIAAERKTLERFRNELRTARRISHRHIGRMYELMEEKGTHFITMEYVRGEDLKSFLKRAAPLSPGRAISISKQICEGLAEAHRMGVVHRDLKPGNIMIDREGHARILDFGIARSLEEKGITGAGVMIGTPEYMSPEQAEAREVDARSDLYSFGVVLFEMATGRLPFEGETALSVAMKHKSEPPPDPKTFNPQLSDDLVGLILRCLEKDKARRFQTASEVLSELEKIERGIPTTARTSAGRKPLTSKEMTVKFTFKKLFITALALIALVVVGVLLRQAVFRKSPLPSPPAPSQRSVAVLPFIDLSPQRDHEWLSDGISEAMINALSGLGSLRVPARTSSFFFKGKDLDIQEIGRKLNAEHVLEGSVQVAGGALRVTAQLISVKDGYHLWSEKFDRSLEDVFSIQDEIAREIVQALKVQLIGEEEIRLTKRHTENLEAYNLYLQGVHFWNKRTPEGVKKGLMCFREAIEKDPGFALAYAGLANSYNLIGFFGSLSPKESFPTARDMALKALELDEDLAEAHAALGTALGTHYWDWAGAEKAFKRAIELNPGYPSARLLYGILLGFVGRDDEAIQELRKGQELDPVSAPITWVLGDAFTHVRHYDRAIRELKKAMELDPGAYLPYLWTVFPYSMKGMHEEAIAAAKRMLELLGEEISPWKILLALAHAAAGNQDEARRILAEVIALSEKRYVSPAYIAGVYGELNEKDKAFEWMHRAYEERDQWLITLIARRPGLDNLREDPRAKALLRKMGLE